MFWFNVKKKINFSLWYSLKFGRKHFQKDWGKRLFKHWKFDNVITYFTHFCSKLLLSRRVTFQKNCLSVFTQIDQWCFYINRIKKFFIGDINIMHFHLACFINSNEWIFYQPSQSIALTLNTALQNQYYLMKVFNRCTRVRYVWFIICSPSILLTYVYLESYIHLVVFFFVAFLFFSCS